MRFKSISSQKMNFESILSQEFDIWVDVESEIRYLGRYWVDIESTLWIVNENRVTIELRNWFLSRYWVNMMNSSRYWVNMMNSSRCFVSNTRKWHFLRKVAYKKSAEKGRFDEKTSKTLQTFEICNIKSIRWTKLKKTSKNSIFA